MNTSQPEVVINQYGKLGQITLNRPQALNALTETMIQAIYQTLVDWQTNPTIQVIVLDSACPKSFCAGGDIRQMYQYGRDNMALALAFFKQEYRLNCLLHAFAKPCVSLLDGITMGGGVGLAMHGAFQVATPDFSFAMPEVGIGFFPDVGAGYLFQKSPGQVGRYLALTGECINANEALFAGLVTHTVPSQTLPGLVDSLCQCSTSHDPFASVSSLLDEKHRALDLQNQFEQHALCIAESFAAETVEEILHRLAVHKGPWPAHTLAGMRLKSPTSLKVALTYLQRCVGLSMPEVMSLDYRLVQRFLDLDDFYEGIRAAVIDKDKQPQWSPACLSAVDVEDISGFFQPSSDGLFD